jgi:hypothetical protein
MLRKLEATSTRESRGKLALKWDGPFRFMRVVKEILIIYKIWKGIISLMPGTLVI